MKPFKLHWQSVKDEYLRPGLASISRQPKSKFGKQRNKNVTIFVILVNFVNNSRYVVVLLVSTQSKKHEHC